MCGIYGALSLHTGRPLREETLARMAKVTVHRGPDDEGRFIDPHMLLGMRRLSIIDLEGGHQPIANEDESLQVVCNGEIYNYRELTRDLERAGHKFRTHSDTEVLVHLYEEYGDDFVRRLNGMYAFALWDIPRRRLLLCRDRLGIKPLYYSEDNGHLFFATEAKAVLMASSMAPAIDPAALREYLSLGYVPAPLSIFRGVRKLPPASLLIAEKDGFAIHRWWTPKPEVREDISDASWDEELLSTMRLAVQSQMVSDVPLGAFLSGGIDSSAIVAFMAQHSSRPVKTYSIGFEGSGPGAFYNELPWARQVARQFGTDHREIIVKPDVAQLLPKLLWHLDEPVADVAFITTYLVSKFAREDVTVILSGVGGDELFGGYRRYLGPSYDRYLNLLPGLMRKRLLPTLARKLPSDRHSFVLNLSRQVRRYLRSQGQSFSERYRSYIEVFDRAALTQLLSEPPSGNHSDALDAAFREASTGDAIARMEHVDLITQLPDDLLMLTDRMTMATSLECRVPWLDDTMVDLSLRMPSNLKIRGRELKHILKRSLAKELPREILHRSKRGFGAPMGAWLKGELRPLLNHVLNRGTVGKRGLLRWEPVAETIALHGQGREDNSDHLQALLNLELWARIYIDGRSSNDVAEELKELVAN